MVQTDPSKICKNFAIKPIINLSDLIVNPIYLFKNKIDVNTFGREVAGYLNMNDIAEVELLLDQESTITPYAINKTLGNFILIDFRLKLHHLQFFSVSLSVVIGNVLSEFIRKLKPRKCTTAMPLLRHLCLSRTADKISFNIFSLYVILKYTCNILIIFIEFNGREKS